MAAYKLRYFGNPKILKLICPQDLFEFLRRFQSFFDRHGLKIPPDDEAAAFDYDRLIQLVSSPRCQTAVELVMEWNGSSSLVFGRTLESVQAIHKFTNADISFGSLMIVGHVQCQNQNDF